MQYGTLLISKAIEANDPNALLRFNVSEADFQTQGERKAFRYVMDYAEKHRGQAPTAEMVANEVPEFQPDFNIEASYDYLAKNLKDRAAEREFIELMNGRIDPETNRQVQEPQLEKRFIEAQKSGDMGKFFEWLTGQAESLKMRTSVRNSVGTDIKRDIDKFKAEYENRKAGESFRIWRSKFDFVNKAMGGYVSSNVYVIYGKSGRGKSAVSLEEVTNCAMQGANVLIWSMEMGWYEVLVRLYVSISGTMGVTTATLDGVDMEAGFNSRDVRQGKLSDEFEAGFMEFLDRLNEIIPGNITVRAVDDEDFGSRTLRDLKSDIIETKADVVLVDPFYYLDYEANTSKTAGGDAANTSQKLRRLAGHTKTTIFALTQADEDDEKETEDGARELKLPQRKDVKKTKALLEDAALLIAVDTNAKEGRGLIGLNKGRDGGEGEVAEIIYLPQIGVVKQPEMGAGAADVFEF
ncbi:DNA helicase [Bacillus amyloliquefaciens]|jgi:replicative DNA helicase|uniref:Replicative DNA helicase n=1 Tax=Bacillus amyloliquefaciens (strain ATCC 23350 / DSM 7 / BCRC 11601 / CCUG 28519 / NBRC 15535 / NRRL B-14393 / F) TaxID=692420 RepID=A0A9P1JFL4_BACAS|nr:DnaB-like helicase C-terminal domain-containing protein [Bacillus amyloliquefaciens]AZV88336.1 DNA helicase [Bacillus amyloliquefaciens]MDR4375183.1 DNA helicase [Bacillus amyloliquefaciens]MEC1838060.1 DnaB-like helicase C-terminal domain-containing protein [Bacillus amyloliquefaciens]MEC1846818.1 DnaB-like helicase C-terminal domain-containing protein [Bacillus amyloliquefaciens]MEC1930511.1 DnaB-like helicase C-terminal domain-containing protein [Bacillus amyloliquefaciens]